MKTRNLAWDMFNNDNLPRYIPCKSKSKLMCPPSIEMIEMASES